MTLHGLINTIYAALAQNRDEDELKALDRQLSDESRKQSPERQQNVNALMTMMRTGTVPQQGR